MNSEPFYSGWPEFGMGLSHQKLKSGIEKSADDGVYVSLDTLLNLRYSVAARIKKSSIPVQQGLTGETLSRRKGPGIEFEDIRPYLPGDDLRHLDWRVTARTGVPYTRRYTEDLERHVMVVCDQRVNMFFGSGRHFKSSLAALLAAETAWLALQQGHRLSGVVASQAVETVMVNSPRRAVLAFCNAVCNHNNSLGVNSEMNVSMADIFDAALGNIKPGMNVTVISDFSDFDQDSAIVLAEIARRGSLVLRRIEDPLELAMTVGGRVGISNGSQIKQMVVSDRVRDSYQKKRAAINLQISQLVQLSGATLVEGDYGVFV